MALDFPFLDINSGKRHAIALFVSSNVWTFKTCLPTKEASDYSELDDC